MLFNSEKQCTSLTNFTTGLNLPPLHVLIFGFRIKFTFRDAEGGGGVGGSGDTVGGVIGGAKADTEAGAGGGTSTVRGGGLIPSIFNSFNASECLRCGRLFYNFPLKENKIYTCLFFFPLSAPFPPTTLYINVFRT